MSTVVTPQSVIPVSCPCGYRTSVPVAYAGRRGRCKRCGSVIPIPTFAPASPFPGVPAMVVEDGAPEPRASLLQRASDAADSVFGAFAKTVRVIGKAVSVLGTLVKVSFAVLLICVAGGALWTLSDNRPRPAVVHAAPAPAPAPAPAAKPKPTDPVLASKLEKLIDEVQAAGAIGDVSYHNGFVDAEVHPAGWALNTFDSKERVTKTLLGWGIAKYGECLEVRILDMRTHKRLAKYSAAWGLTVE